MKKNPSHSEDFDKQRLVISDLNTTNRNLFSVFFLSFAIGLFLSFEDLNIPHLEISTGFGSPYSAISWVFILCLFLILRNGKFTVQIFATHRMKIFALFVFCITIINIVLSELIIRGESTLIKSAKIAFYFLLAYSCLSVGYSLANLSNGIYLRIIGAVSFVLSSFGLLLDKFSSFDFTNISIFHATPNLLYRDRGFSDEPSTLALTLITSLVLLGFKNRSRFITFFMMLGLLFTVSFVQSRGLLPGLFTAVLILVSLNIVKNRHRTFRKIILLVLVCLLIAANFYLSKLLSLAIWQTQRQGISDTTRSFWGLLSAKSLEEYPLGCGLASSVTCTPNLVKSLTNSGFLLATSEDFSEIRKFVFSNSDFMLIPKTWVSILAVHFGIVGVAIAYTLLTRSLSGIFLSSVSSSSFVWTLLVFILLVTATVANSRITSWGFYLAIGALLSLDHKNKEFTQNSSKY